jgi:preprotein translocase subunit SecB
MLKNIGQENIQPILLIECPRQLFPFARRVVADTTRDGGFPPLMLDPIDFLTLYRAQLAQQKAQQPQASV